MKISIVIPVFNALATIAEAVESALAQTYRDFEVIVVDDGSFDDSASRAIEASKSGDSFRIHILDKNQGVAWARNFGAMHSFGGAFLFLDADDKLDSQYLEKTVPLLTEGVGVVGTGMQYFDQSDIYIPPIVPTHHANGIPTASLIRAKAFFDVKGYDGTMMYEDWDLWLRILKVGWRIALLNEPLFLYRIGANARCVEANAMRDECNAQIWRRHGA
jgi:glycosyltransferase involved in cell wall biosynthesis